MVKRLIAKGDGKKCCDEFATTAPQLHHPKCAAQPRMLFKRKMTIPLTFFFFVQFPTVAYRGACFFVLRLIRPSIVFNVTCGPV